MVFSSRSLQRKWVFLALHPQRFYLFLQEIAIRGRFLVCRGGAIFSKEEQEQNNPRRVSKSGPGIARAGVFAWWEVERFLRCAVFGGGALARCLPEISLLSFDFGREGLKEGEPFGFWGTDYLDSISYDRCISLVLEVL